MIRLFYFQILFAFAVILSCNQYAEARIVETCKNLLSRILPFPVQKPAHHLPFIAEQALQDVLHARPPENMDPHTYHELIAAVHLLLLELYSDPISAVEIKRGQALQNPLKAQATKNFSEETLRALERENNGYLELKRFIQYALRAKLPALIFQHLVFEEPHPLLFGPIFSQFGEHNTRLIINRFYFVWWSQLKNEVH